MRLRGNDLLPADVEKHFEVNPAVQTRPGRAQATVTSIMPSKPTPPVDATVPPPEMRRCSLLELDDGQCRWPLGGMHQMPLGGPHGGVQMTPGGTQAPAPGMMQMTPGGSYAPQPGSVPPVPQGGAP